MNRFFIFIVMLLTASPVFAENLLVSDVQKKNFGIKLQSIASARDLPLVVLPALGSPVADGRVAVAVPFGGTVVVVHVVEGQSVKKGQPVVTLFSRDVLAAQSALSQARAEYEMTAAEAHRMTTLAEGGIVAGARLDEAKAHLFQAKARLEEQNRLVSLVKALPRQLGHYQLMAPITGRVSKLGATPGSGIEVMTSAVTVDSTDRLWLEAQLPSDLATSVKTGQSVTVEGVRGNVVAVGSAIDPKTRALLIRAEISGTTGMLPGSTAMMVVMAPSVRGGFADQGRRTGLCVRRG